MNGIKLVVFDLGKVILRISMDNVLLHWSLLSGTPLNTLKQQFFDSNKDVEEFHRGTITEREFRAKVSKQIQFPLVATEFEKSWNSIFLGLMPGVEQIIHTLKDKCRLAILSDTNITHQKYWSSNYYKLLQHFEKFFLSNELGYLKPEAEIFQAVLNGMLVQPEEVLFLDDKKKNTDGAAKLGIRTIQVITPEQMKRELEKTLNIKFS